MKTSCLVLEGNPSRSPCLVLSLKGQAIDISSLVILAVYFLQVSLIGLRKFSFITNLFKQRDICKVIEIKKSIELSK